MKKLALLLCGGILLVVSFSSCDKIKNLFSSDDDSKQDPNVIAGDTNIPLGQVGNEFTPSGVKVGNNYYNVVQPMTVTKNDNGIVTVSIVADLSSIPELTSINNLIPSTLKDLSGKVNTEAQFKITSEGIQDVFNRDHKLHTIVKYDCNVGDQYKLTKSDGNIITRTVTAKSTTDDFPYGIMYIKTITIEQDSRVPGIKKFIYRANHKYGLVYVEVVPENGPSASGYLYPQNY